MRERILALLGLLLVGLVASCDSPTTNRQRANVILAVFDTTRFDDWSYLDPGSSVTPVLDRLAERAQRFANAYSLYPSTVPSHVVLFTGHAVLPLSPRPESPLSDPRYAYRESSLFSILDRNGYRTYAFSGNKNISPETIEALASVHVTSHSLHQRMSEEHLAAILRHYGEWIEKPERLSPVARRMYLRNKRVVEGSGEYVNEAALQHMREHAEGYRDRPYLLFVNYNDAHDPYFPEPPFDTLFASDVRSDFNGNLWSSTRRRQPTGLVGMKLSQTAKGLTETDIERARALHLGELAFADRYFGVLLARLERWGLLKETVIVCVSDHGELFGEYGRMAHSGKPVKELLHVPLIMSFPDPDLEPATIEVPIDLRDVKPTLLDYLGIPDDSSRGRSLLPLIRGGSDPEARALPEPAKIYDAGDADQQNVIGGQDARTTENLIRELRALGYIE